MNFYPPKLAQFAVNNGPQRFIPNRMSAYVLAAMSIYALGGATAFASDAESVYKLVTPSIVKIESKNEERKKVCQGTGFAISRSQIAFQDGFFTEYQILSALIESGKQGALVLTCFHVIESAVFIDLVLPSGAKGYVSAVLAEDPKNDLALLWCFFPPDTEITPLNLKEEWPEVGSVAHVVGCPKGHAFVMSSGIVSGFEKENTEYLLHSVPVSPGSSGAPLVDKNGDVVGVVKATIEGGQNLNVAAPASSALRVAANVVSVRNVASGRSIEFAHVQVASDVQARIDEGSDDVATRELLKLLVAELKNKESANAQQTLAVLLNSKSSMPDDLVHVFEFCVGRLLLRTMRAEIEKQVEQVGQSLDPEKAMQSAYRSSPSHSLAIRHFSASLNANPAFEPALYAHAWQSILAGEFQDAVSSADKLVQAMPYFYESHYIKAKSLAGLRRPSDAADLLAIACRLNPRDGTVLFYYGTLLNELGRHEDAAKAFLSAAKEEDYLEALGSLCAAMSLSKAGQYRESIMLHERAMALDSTPFIAVPARAGIRYCKEMLSK